MKQLIRLVSASVFVIIGMTHVLHAQSATLSVRSSMDSQIYLNDELISYSGFDSLDLTPGSYNLKAVPLNNLSWNLRGFEKSFTLKNGEHRTIEIVFPKLITLTSEPFGANVFHGSDYLGKTPLVIADNALQEGDDIRLQLTGFDEYRMKISNPNDHHAILSPISGNIKSPVLMASPDRQQNTSLKTALLVTSFVTSWSAFYLKREADNSYNKYLRTGNPQDMRKFFNRTERYDNWADVALSVSVVSLGTFMYYLLSE